MVFVHSSDEDYQICLLCLLQSLFLQLSLLFRVEFLHMCIHRTTCIVSLCKVYLVSIDGLKSFEWRDVALCLQLRRTSALAHIAHCIVAYDEYAVVARSVERQYRFFHFFNIAILQQHYSFLTHLTAHVVVVVGTEFSTHLVGVHCRAEYGAQHTGSLVVEHCLRNFSLAHELLKRVGKEIGVVALGFVGCHTVGERSHLYVETSVSSLPSVVCSAPVAYHGSVKSPSLLQYSVEQRVVLAAVYVEPLVV